MHVSGNGRNLVALTDDGILLILPGFERLLSGGPTTPLADIAIVLNFIPLSQGAASRRAIYLALSEMGEKIAVTMVDVFSSYFLFPG